MDGETLDSSQPTETPESLATVAEVDSPDGRFQAFSHKRETLALMPDQSGMSGYLAPKYVLADRGLFFVDGAFKKTAKERMNGAHHLYDHDTWRAESIIGTHTFANEDEKGLYVTAILNDGNPLAALVMSNYRFGIKYGWSYGFDIIRDRSGTPEDDKRLDRSGAPHLANIPINELRAVTETRAWEGSTVPWGAIHSAGPDVIQRRFAQRVSAPEFDRLLSALTAGTATPEQLKLAEQIVTAFTSRAAAGSDHGTREQQGTPTPIPRRDWEVALVGLKNLDLSLLEFTA